MEFSSDVTIIGAGLNGLTLSLALERVGFKVTIIDSGDLKKKILNRNFDGRAYALAKASQNLFEALGLWSALSSYSQPIFDVRVTDGDKDAGPSNFHMHFNHKDLASLLVNNQIIAVARDREEFGARALGNRSIIANPSNYGVVQSINESIKNRDFWMPFAPSILAEREKDYIVNPKHIEARFMAVGFDSTELAKKHMTAGLHPFDRTARPQIVHKADNPSYHSLLKAFEEISGVGALMNTSFNIHGESIVCTPYDAIDTFLRCGLHHLLIGPWLISKQK